MDIGKLVIAGISTIMSGLTNTTNITNTINPGKIREK